MLLMTSVLLILMFLPLKYSYCSKVKPELDFNKVLLDVNWFILKNQSEDPKGVSKCVYVARLMATEEGYNVCISYIFSEYFIRYINDYNYYTEKDDIITLYIIEDSFRSNYELINADILKPRDNFLNISKNLYASDEVIGTMSGYICQYTPKMEVKYYYYLWEDIPKEVSPLKLNTTKMKQ